MKERLIHRPNEFTAEEWESLTREQQIAWCKTDMARKPKGPPLDPLIYVQMFEEGSLTTFDTAIRVFEHLTVGNLATVIAGCSPPALSALTEVAARFPGDSDDLGWTQKLFVRMVAYAPWVTAEDIQRIEEQQSRQLRDGVRLFRTARGKG